MRNYTQLDRHSNQPSSKVLDDPENPGLAIALPLPTEIALSLAMLPMLAVLVSSQLASRTLHELGSNSEELFRGSRLPTLPLLNPST